METTLMLGSTHRQKEHLIKETNKTEVKLRTRAEFCGFMFRLGQTTLGFTMQHFNHLNYYRQDSVSRLALSQTHIQIQIQNTQYDKN